MDRAAVIANLSAGSRRRLIVSSFERLTGRRLLGEGEDLWSAKRAVVAHGLEADPIFFYGNHLALELFETDVSDFVRMPSRLSAEPLERDERARLLARVSKTGFIDNYSGVRISATGRRFRIDQAVVWTLIDETGRLHGQAATFDRWTSVE